MPAAAGHREVERNAACLERIVRAEKGRAVRTRGITTAHGDTHRTRLAHETGGAPHGVHVDDAGNDAPEAAVLGDKDRRPRDQCLAALHEIDRPGQYRAAAVARFEHLRQLRFVAPVVETQRRLVAGHGMQQIDDQIARRRNVTRFGVVAHQGRGVTLELVLRQVGVDAQLGDQAGNHHGIATDDALDERAYGAELLHRRETRLAVGAALRKALGDLTAQKYQQPDQRR